MTFVYIYQSKYWKYWKAVLLIMSMYLPTFICICRYKDGQHFHSGYVPGLGNLKQCLALCTLLVSPFKKNEKKIIFNFWPFCYFNLKLFDFTIWRCYYLSHLFVIENKCHNNLNFITSEPKDLLAINFKVPTKFHKPRVWWDKAN